MVLSESVFITQFNFKKIIPKQFPDGMYKNIEDLIQYTKIKKIFNDDELHQFVRLWSILENPEFLVQHYINYVDKNRPEAYSSYHSDKSCIELSKSYLDYTINHSSRNVRELVSSKIRYAFRDYTYGSNSSTRLRFDFKEPRVTRIDEDGVEFIQGTISTDLYNEITHINNQHGNILGHLFDIIPNSGMFSYENLSLDSIESKVNELLESSERFRNSDEFIQRKIDNITYADINTLKRKVGEKEKIWVGTYKEPLSSLIQNYYWIKFNPSLSVEKSVLDSLGFKPCRRCMPNVGNKA
ncbi:hypothetical protein ACQ2HG_18240 [Aeromonas hydrophila]|uniref:hypothetical protein n=1 Tax=Aeromonas hydrophila TaxID=644 RepID=UPI001C5ABDDF|nr:hypothetical protein [Aeromonas hydrophila]MBW3846341.1 hypothetical protein [Aeromonas hydrophila]